MLDDSEIDGFISQRGVLKGLNATMGIVVLATVLGVFKNLCHSINYRKRGVIL